jgi:uncharacterized UPF0160 family protein
MMNITKGYTHGAVFHADDVFSTALLKILCPGIEIVRTLGVPELGETEICYDIGGGPYDHHQEMEFRDEEQTKPYAALGKLWRAFGHELVDDAGWQMIEDSLVIPIDQHDNGMGDGNSVLSKIITFMNPSWDEPATDEVRLEKFNAAVEFATTVWKTYLDKAASTTKAVHEFDNAERLNNKTIILDRFVPWKDVIKQYRTDSEVILAVYPSSRGGYCIETISSFKWPLPYPWLKQLPEGMTFCHVSRFLAAVDTKENAIKYVKEALEKIEARSDPNTIGK